MSSSLFVRSVIIGLTIAAPVGPIGVLVIKRTLSEGRLTGLATGMGAATADALYGAIGAFGLTLITSLLVSGDSWLRLIGGLFLIYLGVRTLLSKAATEAVPATAATRLRAYVSTFLLTMTNPLTILSFVAVFASLGLASDAGDPVAAITVVSGVFLGSALWWLTLSGVVSIVRHRIGSTVLTWVNRVSGVVVLLFGIYALIS